MDNLILAFAIDGEDTIGIKAESTFLVEASSPHVELLDSDIGFRVTEITKEAQSLSPEFLAGACPEVVRMDVDGPDLSDLLFASTVLADADETGQFSIWVLMDRQRRAGLTRKDLLPFLGEVFRRLPVIGRSGQ